MSDVTRMMSEAFDALGEAGAGGRTKRFTEGGEMWESFSLKDLMEFADWVERRRQPARFTPIQMTDV